MVLADGAHPGRAVGQIAFYLAFLGFISWGIVHLIRKRRRPGPAAQQQPYWDGSAWRYPPQTHTQVPQPYWHGSAWRYPAQQPPYPTQPPPYPAQQQPPFQQPGPPH